MPLYPETIASLRELAAMGVNDLSPEEVISLNDAGRALHVASREEGSVCISSPVVANGVRFWPLTCAGADFLEWWIAPERHLPKSLERWILPFALVNGRELNRFSGIISLSDLSREIKKWKKTLPISPEEVDEACSCVLDDDDFMTYAIMRQRSESLCDWVSKWNRDLGESFRMVVRDYCDNAEEEEATAKRKGAPKEIKEDAPYGRWKKFACELAATTGVSPEYWMQSDRKLALIAYRKAMENTAMSGGAFGKDNLSIPVMLAIKKQRELMFRIVNIRKNEQQNP